ncbi:glycosyltransferase family 2 protein [Nostoc sp. TCL26-01]|uniref:glycosyltransferase family 2 protein n=1 Tax=Nostoc sp. TCL26-01 TaxID=2576904 RepID=UPI0015BBA71B|nr:glycosyltransferase family 2 protein [Nostoc sp. TCL26-01]QLE56101.1 glycosyltransferase family 2 protein [Nostoc sp. TCL26-01]
MNKLLTIAIPTYNRAELLDQQLTWLANAVKGFEADCEILVSDNCSTDNTQDIIQKWQQQLDNITFKSHKHPENLGVMKNIMYCLSSAETKYVWTIGDDDPVQDRAIPYVINKIKQHEDLGLLFLNFSGRNKITGQPVYPPTIIGNRWFDADCEDGCGDSKAIFEYCFAKSVGAVIFLSASIYRTDLVKQALKKWTDAASNWISLAYLAGYCAAHGRLIITRETYLECIVGVSYWQKEPKSALLMQYKHIPEVILKLQENGYSQQFCQRMLLHNSKEVNLKVFLGALRRWPVSAIKVVVPFLALVSMTAFDVIAFREMRLSAAIEPSSQEIRSNNKLSSQKSLLK